MIDGVLAMPLLLTESDVRAVLPMADLIRTMERALMQFSGGQVDQPSCFIAGAKDLVRRFVPNYDLYENVASNCTDLRVKRIIAGAGHWVQQEAPEAVNAALLEFLATLD